MKKMKKITTLMYALTLLVIGVNAQQQIRSEEETPDLDGQVTGIDVNGDSIWVCTENGLLYYDDNTCDTIFFDTDNSELPENGILSVFADANGDLWIGTKNNGVVKYDGTDYTFYNQSNSGLPNDQYNVKIKGDNLGNIWIASYNSMAKFDGAEWQTWVTGSEISSWSVIVDFDITDNNIVWLCSADGIGKIENNEYVLVSTVGSGLISSTGSLSIDEEGVVWVSIANNGIYKYENSEFVNYTTTSSYLPTNNVLSIDFDENGKMWLGTDIGLVTYDDLNYVVYQPSSDGEKYLSKIYCDKNSVIWCGTLDGTLLKFDISAETFDVKAVISSVGDIISDETSSNLEFEVYPNPVKTEMTISLDLQSENVVKAGIYDLTGKLVQTISTDIFNTKSGNYQVQICPSLQNNQMFMVNLMTDKGKTFSSKFIIQR